MEELNEARWLAFEDRVARAAARCGYELDIISSYRLRDADGGKSEEPMTLGEIEKFLDTKPPKASRATGEPCRVVEVRAEVNPEDPRSYTIDLADLGFARQAA